MKRKEIIIIIALICISCVLFLINHFNSSLVVVHVYKGEELIDTLDLNTNSTYSYIGNNGQFNIEVKDKKVRAYDVDCPNKICEHTGWISIDNPLSIICLPNNMVVKIDEK